jgi:hypothetical protein
MATNSKLSERFPKVIRPATMIVRGMAMGTKSAKEKNISLANKSGAMPLPTSSSINFQRNCIKNRNIDKKKVTAKGPT